MHVYTYPYVYSFVHEIFVGRQQQSKAEERLLRERGKFAAVSRLEAPWPPLPQSLPCMEILMYLYLYLYLYLSMSMSVFMSMSVCMFMCM